MDVALLSLLGLLLGRLWWPARLIAWSVVLASVPGLALWSIAVVARFFRGRSVRLHLAAFAMTPLVAGLVGAGGYVAGSPTHLTYGLLVKRGVVGPARADVRSLGCLLDPVGAALWLVPHNVTVDALGAVFGPAPDAS